MGGTTEDFPISFDGCFGLAPLIGGNCDVVVTLTWGLLKFCVFMGYRGLRSVMGGNDSDLPGV